MKKKEEMVIDISVVNSYKNEFDSEYSKFKYGLLNNFDNSYLKNVNDEYIKVMAARLELLMEDINKSYYYISKWWNSYVNDATNLENYLSNNTSSGTIESSIVRNFVSRKFKVLNSKNFDIKSIK